MLFKTEKSDAIMNFLKEKFLINENIIGVIENLPSAEIYVDNVDNPKGVLVKKDEYMHYVYTDNDDFLDEMCNSYLTEGFFGFSGVEGELAEKIRQRHLLGWESRCTLYYMPKENLDLTLMKNQAERIRLEDAETVDKFYQYRHPGTIEIIKRDITRRPSSAIYIDDDIACWVLIHDDNSMGIMYTKEEHRRKGYAVDVTIDLAHQIIQENKIPFIQIVEGNGMSPGLAKKCGFIEAGKADWFGIIAGTPKEIIETNNKSLEQFLTVLPEAQHAEIYNKSTEYIGLFNFLHNFKYQSPTIDGINLVKADSEQEKTVWSEITAVNAHLFSDPKYNLYIMLKGGTAVAASMTQKDEDEDRGLYLLSVAPEYKDSDILKILISETIQTEKNSGCYFMTTQIEERFAALLKEFGFRESHKCSH